MSSESLQESLSQAVPVDTKLCFRHIVTPQNPCPPLFAPPSGCNDILTTCEKHLLVISTPPADSVEHTAAEARTSKQRVATGVENDAGESKTNEGRQGCDNNGEILLFALEVFVYDEASLTTIFVSKADSTGYLYKLPRPADAHKDKRSLVKSISTAFLSHIISLQSAVGHEDKKIVLSLFARAQDQYLFPGSIDNPHKHVLDDRELIKWWCRVVDPLLVSNGHSRNAKMADAHLIVPGCDERETRSFFPRAPSPPSCPHSRRGQWHYSYPLKDFCPRPDAPPRCLVPRFEDDPKARFLFDLDAEIRKPDGTSFNPSHDSRTGGEGDSRSSSVGEWRSIKTLDQFWELMAFRQECSAGRLVGFLWLVLKPHVSSEIEAVRNAPEQSQEKMTKGSFSIHVAPESSKTSQPVVVEDQSSKNKDSHFSSRTETTPAGNMGSQEHLSDRPISSCITPAPSSAISSSQGGAHLRVLISAENYDKLFEHLISLDFDNEADATKSTWSYIQQLSHLSFNHFALQGAQITGVSSFTPATAGVVASSPSQPSTPNLLSSNLIRKRKSASDQGSSGAANDMPSTEVTPDAPPVNILGAGTVRKKKKNA